MPPDETVGEVIARIERVSSAVAIVASVLGLGLMAIALLVARSWVVSSLTVALLVSAAVTTFDKRVTQARMRGVTFPQVGPFREIGPDTPSPAAWFGIVYWMHIGLLCALFVANWKAAILVYVGGFILASCGFLETLGGLLLVRSGSRSNIA